MSEADTQLSQLSSDEEEPKPKPKPPEGYHPYASAGASPFGHVQPTAIGQRLAARIADRLASADKLRQEGNKLFKEGEWKKAIKKYHHSLMYTKGILDKFEALPGVQEVTRVKATPQEEAAARELSATVSNNLAACLMKTQEWEKVVVHSNKVLELQSDNTKALFRRGVANMNLNKMWRAESDLRKAATLDPEDAAIKKQLQALQHRMKHHEKEEQLMYSAMFKS